MEFLSIDIEATGLDPVEASLLQVGIVHHKDFEQSLNDMIKISIFCNQPIYGSIEGAVVNAHTFQRILQLNNLCKMVVKNGVMSTSVNVCGSNQRQRLQCNYNTTTDVFNVHCDKNCGNVISVLDITEHEFEFLRPNESIYLIPSWNRSQDIIQTRFKKQTYTVAGKNYGMFDSRFIAHNKIWPEGWHIRHRSIDPTALFILRSDTVPPNLQICKERAGIEDTVVHHEAIEDALDVIKCSVKVWS